MNISPVHIYITTPIGVGLKTHSELVHLGGATVVGIVLNAGIVSATLNFFGQGSSSDTPPQELRTGGGSLISITTVTGIVLFQPNIFQGIASIQLDFPSTETAPLTEITWIARPV